MLGVNESGRAARLLRLGDHLQRERGLAGRFRSENLHHAAARESADAESRIERDGAGWNHRDRQNVAGTEPEHGPLSELLVHLAEGGINGALTRGVRLWGAVDLSRQSSGGRGAIVSRNTLASFEVR